MQNFINDAKGLSKNPLGIIALFISLIYAIAALILSTGSDLEPAQKWPIIWFIVIFPMFTLIAFLILVIWHHTKLYAPGDYKEDGTFVALSSSRQREKIETDIKEILDQEEAAIEEVKIAEARETKEFEANKDLATSLKVFRSDIGKVKESAKSYYFLVEDLAFRRLETEYGFPIQRHRAFEAKNELIEIDGVSRTQKGHIAFELKYSKRGRLDKATIMQLYQKACNLEKAELKNFKLIIVLLYEEKKIINVNELKNLVSGLSIDCDIEEYDVETLKSDFGVE